jgi:hypothetical protein
MLAPAKLECDAGRAGPSTSPRSRSPPIRSAGGASGSARARHLTRPGGGARGPRRTATRGVPVADTGGVLAAEPGGERAVARGPRPPRRRPVVLARLPGLRSRCSAGGLRKAASSDWRRRPRAVLRHVSVRVRRQASVTPPGRAPRLHARIPFARRRRRCHWHASERGDGVGAGVSIPTPPGLCRPGPWSRRRRPLVRRLRREAPRARRRMPLRADSHSCTSFQSLAKRTREQEARVADWLR